MKRASTYLFVSAALVALSLPVGHAQERQGIKSTPLAKKAVSGMPDKELLILSIELEPGGASGLHTHPGDEHGTVVEGNLMVKIGDEEYKPVNAGETFSAPLGTVMGIMNKSDKPTKVIGVLLVDKGKPYSTPVK
ncbi:MAG TPA: cupin domain-containing protein [Burkholderiales bacterium]|nr:cupin domain-containing protein [Burkholderiales bacterium]